MQTWTKPWQAAGSFGVFGKYLTFQNPEPLPADTMNQVRRAFEEGRQFPETLIGLTVNGATKQGVRIVKRLVQNAALPTYHPWMDVYKAIFWFGAEWRLSGDHGLKRAIGQRPLFGTQMRRALTRAFPNIAIDDRRTIFDLHHQFGWERRQWNSAYNGAMSVSRTAWALRQLSIRTILPEAWVDARRQIDLFGEVTGDTTRLVCLQVTSERSRELSSTEYVPLYRSDVADQSPNAAMVHAMRRFINEQNLVHARAAMVFVGRDDNLPWEYEKTVPLCESLSALILP